MKKSIKRTRCIPFNYLDFISIHLECKFINEQTENKIG